jgi:hypothetical protein
VFNSNYFATIEMNSHMFLPLLTHSMLMEKLRDL